MRFDHHKFFNGFKANLDHTLDQAQVNGIEFLLTSFETSLFWNDIRQMAYAWATVFHETAGSMQPVEEGYYLEAKHGPDFLHRFQNSLRYAPYFGRGYVQLTWETPKIPNYSKATRELRRQMPDIVADFEQRTGEPFDLLKYPKQALDAEIAFGVMTLGMLQGWFTGKKLGEFVNANGADYVNARRIINGLDKATLIAHYAKVFESVLRYSQISAAAAPSSQPATVDPPKSESKDQPQQPPTTQNAETIVNTGDVTPTPVVPDPQTMAPPPSTGTTNQATKVTIGGLVVPPVLVAIWNIVDSAMNRGFFTAQQISDTVIKFMTNNTKYFLMLLGLFIVFLMLKRIERLVIYVVSMITHAVPSWSSVTVEPADAPAKKWWQI